MEIYILYVLRYIAIFLFSWMGSVQLKVRIKLLLLDYISKGYELICGQLGRLLTGQRLRVGIVDLE